MAGIPALAADLRDLLRAFADHEVRFLIVGGYALAVHGHPRATGDLDVWIDCSRATPRARTRRFDPSALRSTSSRSRIRKRPGPSIRSVFHRSASMS